jgi:alkylation response protein AidB-like acyl-CoA dehydrogenase
VTVSFSLSPQQEQLKAVARQFAEAHLRDLAEAVRNEPDPARRADLARPCVRQGRRGGIPQGADPGPFGGPRQRGGRGHPHRGVGVAQPDFVISMAGPLIALVPVYQVGTPEQIQRFVAPFLADSGTPVAAMAYSEPAGSANFDAPPPAEGTRTTAVPDGDDYVVNGSKAWASHLPGWDGDGPDVMTIVCRAPGGVSLVVAEREHLAGHVEVQKLYDLPGLRGCLTAHVRLRDVAVPRANLVGAEGQGVELTRNAFIGSGASIGTFAVAAMRQAFDVAYRFATTERRGGAVPIIEHQAVSDALANAKARIEAVRLLSWRALDAGAVGRPAGARMGAARQGVRLRDRGPGDQRPGPGGRRLAYDTDFPLLRHLHEALAYPVIEGSNIGVRRRQMQALLTSDGYNPLAASGMA